MRLIQIDSLLTERMLAAHFLAAFRARRLEEKFFYWFPLSVRAWLALCSDGAYRNYVRSRSLVARSADDLARRVAGDVVEVVSLGAGQGDKDLMLLHALRAGGMDPSYRPVDTSLALLEIAAEGALAAGVPVRGTKADFTDPAQLAELAAGSGTPRRLVLLLGNTLGAFDPVLESRALASLLRPDDLLLVDGELYAGRQTVAGYDNPLNRRFAWAPLHSVGIREPDGRLIFEDRRDERLRGLHPLTKFFEAERPCEALVGGETLGLAAGERVMMNHSYKYSRDAFLGLLAAAGLAPLWEGTSEDQRFMMVLARLA